MISARRCASYRVFLIMIVYGLVLFVRTGLAQDRELVVLKLILNREEKGEFFLIIAPDHNIWMKRTDLSGVGFIEGVGGEDGFDGETYVSLKSIRELTYELNEENASLEITATPDVLRSHDADISYKKSYEIESSGTHGAAFINYAMMYDDMSEDSRFELSGEIGLSVNDYFGSSTFKFEKTSEDERWARLITNIIYNDRDNMTTWTLGDAPARSGILGSSAVVGGITYSRNFSVNPDFQRFPQLNLKGALNTPSDIYLYVNDYLVRKERLSPGKFMYSDVPATAGYGEAKLVIKDIYGQEVSESIPYYFSTRLLRKALHEYSYSFGFLREKLGTESFLYGDPVFLAFHNYGFTENLKIGYAAEGASDVINIGPSMTILVPNLGVLDTAITYSNNKGKSGSSGYINYSFQSRAFNANAFIRTESRNYSSLALQSTDDKTRFQYGVALGFGGRKAGYISAEYTHSSMYEAEGTSRLAASYNRALTERATFYAIASRTKDTEVKNEMFFGMHIYFGKGISGNAGYASSDEMKTERLRLQKSLPAGSGFGFKVDLQESNGKELFEGRAGYQNNWGSYEASYSNRDKDNGFAVSMSGGVGYIDKSLFLSRTINDSFAKVKVADLKDVRVYYNGNETGRTNSKGEIIIPDIHSFHDSRIAIESSDIPLNYTLRSLTQYISPSFRSASLIEFDVKKTQGITGSVYLIQNGGNIPVEYSTLNIQVDSKEIEGIIGKEGEFYIENIPAGKHKAALFYKGRECRFELEIPESDETILDIGKIICEIER